MKQSCAMEGVCVTIENPAFCLFLYLTGVHFRGELQHGGDVSQQKIKCRPIRTREIGGVTLSDVLYVCRQNQNTCTWEKGFLRNLSENSWTLFRRMPLDLSLEILLANIHKKYLSRIKKTYLTLIIFQQTCFCLIQDIVIYLIWSFLQKPFCKKLLLLRAPS